MPDRRTILATLAIAATAGGIALAPSDDATEAETAVSDGVESSDDLNTQKVWTQAYTVTDGVLVETRTETLTAFNGEGVKVGALETLRTDVTNRRPCEIVQSQDVCASMGDKCIRTAEWAAKAKALTDAGVTLPVLAECPERN